MESQPGVVSYGKVEREGTAYTFCVDIPQGLNAEVCLVMTDFVSGAWYSRFSLQELIESLVPIRPEDPATAVCWISEALQGETVTIKTEDGGQRMQLCAYYSTKRGVKITLRFPPENSMAKQTGERFHALCANLAASMVQYIRDCNQALDARDGHVVQLEKHVELLTEENTALRKQTRSLMDQFNVAGETPLKHKRHRTSLAHTAAATVSPSLFSPSLRGQQHSQTQQALAWPASPNPAVPSTLLADDFKMDATTTMPPTTATIADAPQPLVTTTTGAGAAGSANDDGGEDGNEGQQHKGGGAAAEDDLPALPASTTVQANFSRASRGRGGRGGLAGSKRATVIGGRGR